MMTLNVYLNGEKVAVANGAHEALEIKRGLEKAHSALLLDFPPKVQVCRPSRSYAYYSGNTGMGWLVQVEENLKYTRQRLNVHVAARDDIRAKSEWAQDMAAMYPNMRPAVRALQRNLAKMIAVVHKHMGY